MFVLHVELKLKPGVRQELEKTYREVFLPAITPQPGFQSAQLLRPVKDGAGGADDYRLTLAFDRQELQRLWVGTDLHQEAWPRMANRCVEFFAKGYETV